MTLQSPTAESEYLSEVFAGEMEEPVPSDALNNLLTSSHPAPLTSRFSGKVGPALCVRVRVILTISIL